MIYQICKEIGAMSAVLKGRVDAIVLTGGFCRFQDVLEGIEDRCGWIAPTHVYPGEVEQEALHDAVMRVLNGEDKASVYTGEPVWKGFDWE